MLELVLQQGRLELDCLPVSPNHDACKHLKLIYYSYGQLDFWRRCTFPKWDDWNIAYTKKGIWNMRRTRAMRALAVLLAIVGAHRLHKSGLGVRDIKEMMQNIVQGSLHSVVQVWRQVRGQVAM